jgi:hydrogenase maturation protease
MKPKRILIAGVGNIFMRDDGFAAEVVKQLAKEPLPRGMVVRDFGTGGLKLAYDLLAGYDILLLVDAAKRGGLPGTLYVIEPDPDEHPPDLSQGGPIDPHWTDAQTVLRFVKALGAWPAKVLIVACEPAVVEEFEVGLSQPVREAVPRAVRLILSTAEEVRGQTEEEPYEHARHAA